jgi:hypothetical protein
MKKCDMTKKELKEQIAGTKYMINKIKNSIASSKRSLAN